MNRGVFAAEFSDKFEDVFSSVFSDEFPSASGSIPDPMVFLDRLDLPEAAGDGGPMINFPADDFVFALPSQASSAAVAATADDFVFTLPDQASPAAVAAAAGSSPTFSVSGVSVDVKEFVFARPDGSGGGGDGGGGKPPKDGGDGDTGGLLTSYTSGGNAKKSYNITVNFEADGWSTELQQVFIKAADYISTIILGDLSDERVPLFGRVDDLAIDASITWIDDVGGVLGGAAVFASRVGSELPAASIMQFDVEDVGTALDGLYLKHIVVHEMVHAMGFGGKWVDMGLVQTFSEDDGTGQMQDVLRFTGENATAEYNELEIAVNDPRSANGVLVEMDGGAGTAFVHWDETTFADLLMTGFIDTKAPGEASLSRMSIAALEDMGYDTIYVPTLDDGLLIA